MPRGLYGGSGGGRRDRARGRVRAGRGDDGRGRQALRVHDDVALPARGEQGRAGAADARRRARHRAARWSRRTGAQGWSSGRARCSRSSTVTRGASTCRSPACSARTRSSPGSTAGSRRWRRPGSTTAPRPRSSCCFNGYVFWSARLRFQVPDEEAIEVDPAGLRHVARTRRWRAPVAGDLRGRIDDPRRRLRVRARARARRDRGADRPRATRARRLIDRAFAVASSSSDRSTSTSSSPSRRLPAAGETVAGGRFARHGGGKSANQAVAAARLGAAVSFVGAVGDDEMGTEAVAELSREGIDVSGVARRVGADGRRADRGRRAGENQIAVASGANAALAVDTSLDLLLADGDPVSSCSATRSPRRWSSPRRGRRDAAGWPVVLNPAPARDAPRRRRSPCSRRTPPRPPSSPAATTPRTAARALVDDDRRGRADHPGRATARCCSNRAASPCACRPRRSTSSTRPAPATPSTAPSPPSWPRAARWPTPPASRSPPPRSPPPPRGRRGGMPTTREAVRSRRDRAAARRPRRAATRHAAAS